MLIALALAFADPSPELEAAARLRSLAHAEAADTWVAQYRLQGHGPVPGHEVAFTAILQHEVRPHGTLVAVAGDDSTQSVWIPHTGPTMEHERAEWTESTDWTAAMALAPWPDELAAWLASRPASLWPVDDQTIAWSSEQGMATIHLGEGGLEQIVLRRDHSVFGDVEDRILWTDGTVELHRAQTDSRWSAVLAPGEGEATPAAPPPVEPLPIHDLGDGLWAIDIPAAHSRSYAYVRGDEGVVLDAPLSDAIGQELLDRVQALGPNVAWSVVVSHHHPHYVGGLRPFVRAGVPIHAHEDLVDWLRGQLVQPRRRDGDDAPAAPELHPIGRRTQLLDGAVRLHRLDEDSGHTDAFVATELPELGALYIADLGACYDEREPWTRGAWPELAAKRGLARILSAFPLDGTRPDCPFDAFEP